VCALCVCVPPPTLTSLIPHSLTLLGPSDPRPSTPQRAPESHRDALRSGDYGRLQAGREELLQHEACLACVLQFPRPRQLNHCCLLLHRTWQTCFGISTGPEPAHEISTYLQIMVRCSCGCGGQCHGADVTDMWDCHGCSGCFVHAFLGPVLPPRHPRQTPQASYKSVTVCNRRYTWVVVTM
jgi:hypothetical protein